MQNVLNHSLIRSLTNSAKLESPSFWKNSGHSYIPGKTFALAVFDTLFPADGKTPDLVHQAQTLIAQDTLPEGLKTILKLSSNQACNKLTLEAQKLLDSTDVKPEIKTVLTNLLNTSGNLLSQEVNRLIEQATLPDDVRHLLSNYLNRTEIGLQQFRDDLEKWYDDCMERVSGWYKRRTQFIVAVIASIACVTLNIDTLAVANHLFRAPADRAAIISLAESVVKEGEAKEINSQTKPGEPTPELPPQPSDAASDQKKREMDDQILKDRLDKLLSLTDKAAIAQIGWQEGSGLLSPGIGGWLLKACGWALSIFAALFGAPFWFDLLTKTLNMRNAGQKPA